MKIKDVVIKEMGSRGYVPPKQAAQPAQSPTTADDMPDMNPMGDATGMSIGTAKQFTPQPAPSGAAGQAKWPTTDAEIRAFQKANGLKVDGMIGGKTMAALQKAGAQPPAGFKPVGNKQAAPKTPKADAKPAADPTKDPYDPNKDTNVQMTPQSVIQTAQSDADKKAAIGGNLPPVAAAPEAPVNPPTTGPNVAPTNTAANVPQGGAGPNTSPWGGKANAPSANAMADFQRLAGITPTVSPSGQSAQPSGNKPLPPGLAGATTPQGSAEPPTGQAAQPQANPDGTGSGVNTDYGNMTPQDARTAYDAQLQAQGKPGLEKGQGVVGTGTGKAMTTGTGSPLQYDHSDAMMAWRQAHPMQSPPDHATAKKWYDQVQARKANPQPGFLDNLFGKKQQDAGPTGNVNNQSSGYTQKESSELSMLRKLSGLK